MNGNRFEQIEKTRLGRNRFDMSYSHKLSFKIGELIPTCIQEVLPGDQWLCGSEMLCRFPSLISPVMDRIEICTDWYFVPLRIIDPAWEDWSMGKVVTTWPFANGMNTLAIGDLGDYLEIPLSIGAGNGVGVYPAAAYALIFDEWYRDQNLQSEEYIDVIAGNNTGYGTFMRNPPLKVNLKHDYFTSALPSTQFGSAVTLPLVSNDDVLIKLDPTATTAGEVLKASDHTTINNAILGTTPAGGKLEDTVTSVDMVYDPADTLLADFTGEATDIITVRRAFKLQEYLEQLMRTGRRYKEYLQGIWDEFAGDARLDRPEMFGYSKSFMKFSEVLSTSETRQHDSNTVDLPVGALHGHGIGILRGRGNQISCPEHGIIMAITFLRPDNSYQDGLHKMYRRKEYLDYAIPQFAHIGEQAVTKSEIYGPSTDMDGTFAYQERYAEYKHRTNQVSGEFRTTLKHYHFGFDYSAQPVFNESFIQCDATDYDRIFAVASQPQVYAEVYNKCAVLRKLPQFSTPKM